MKIRVVAMVLVLVLSLGMLAACGKSGVVTQEEAQKIALKEAGLTASQVTDIHTHVTTVDGIPCYSVHITTEDDEFSVVINASDGSILE